MQEVATYPVSHCTPSGLALGPNQNLLLGCSGYLLILNATSGRVVATIAQVNGCDEVWYNAGDQRYYLAAAFKNFFGGSKAGRKTGYSKFKSRKRSRQSFYLANDKFTVGDHWIDVPKLGRVNMAGSLRFQGKILSARISKSASWWFVSITVEMPDEMASSLKSPVGVDVGLNQLASLSDGRRY